MLLRILIKRKKGGKARNGQSIPLIGNNLKMEKGGNDTQVQGKSKILFCSSRVKSQLYLIKITNNYLRECTS